MFQVTPRFPGAPRVAPAAGRRLLLGAAALALAVGTPVTSAAQAAPLGTTVPSVAPVAVPGTAVPSLDPVPSSLAPVGRQGDHLTVVVREAGRGSGTFEVYCHPGGGNHPQVDAACALLDRKTQWGRDTFAPPSDGSVCTMQYGGPATARITGVWAGRPVDATFDRRDGCRIGQWDRLVPLLPDLSPPPRATAA
ncbi:SSI family serine proteinase inhibitor [Streptomyces sp. NPDC091279]|uniref:SSI family serine proteinase inhibitor n=1 Tax=unclassified Streptomyces TaxID=2593676 RepID=UPI00382E7902